MRAGQGSLLAGTSPRYRAPDQGPARWQSRGDVAWRNPADLGLRDVERLAPQLNSAGPPIDAENCRERATDKAERYLSVARTWVAGM